MIKNLNLLGNLLHKKFLSSKKKYYSFSGVDIIINNIFRNINNGIYLDVGCQHPINNNNTYLLYKRGWRGVNIDLDQDNIDLFNISRPNDLNICNAVSSDIKDVDLYFYHKKSPINTIEKKVSDFQKAQVQQIKKIKTNTLNNILNNSIFKNKQFNLMSVDVEGHELDVFFGFDFGIYSPKVIVVEFLDLSLEKIEIKDQNVEKIISSDLYNFMMSKGYKLVNFIYSDLIFVKNT